MPTAAGDRHARDSQRLLQQAHYELHKKGDRLQASDKAAGAVAHGVKAFAFDRQWRHSSHNLRRRIIHLLAAEFDQPELITLQGDADQMHDNYYEDRLHEWELDVYLDRIAEGLELLRAVRAQGENPDYTPTPEHQQAITRILLTAEEIAELESFDYPPELPPFEEPEE